MEDFRYPIGRYRAAQSVAPRDVAKWIDEIEALPRQLQTAVSSLSDEQQDTPYRKGGWTIRQVVHHIFDSHANSYIRFKLALTEDRPTIKPYDQEAWAKLSDSKLPVDVSLNLIKGLHERWGHLLKSLDEAQLSRELVHPESGTLIVKSMIGLYAWHGKHHLAHITNLKKQKNWT
ncbi:MAG TPA: putative metal-dependent hydrolase [Balneolaceae bacterium]|nr:putative metal-dependent hydrolase [Balneolaceae bacterium]